MRYTLVTPQVCTKIPGFVFIYDQKKEQIMCHYFLLKWGLSKTLPLVRKGTPAILFTDICGLPIGQLKNESDIIMTLKRHILEKRESCLCK